MLILTNQKSIKQNKTNSNLLKIIDPNLTRSSLVTNQISIMKTLTQEILITMQKTENRISYTPKSQPSNLSTPYIDDLPNKFEYVVHDQ